MSIVEFRGFAGVRLEADQLGAPEDPAVLLIHGGGQTRAVWGDVADALVQAGRQVINLDLRGHGGSEWPVDGRYDLTAFAEDVRAVLAQMATRPVVVAATLGGWIATAALSRDAANLAAGLVLVDLPTQVDPAATGAMGDRLRRYVAEVEAAGGTPRWDKRLIAAIDIDAMPAMLRTAAPALNLPVLFVRGGLSPLAGTADAAEFVGALPNCEAVEVDNADLLVTTDRMESFNGILLDFLERRMPRAAPEYRSGSDARTLRDALGCFATGVTIVTTFAADGLPVGLTANSFTSVSLEPPLLLVCIARSAGSLAAFETNERFGVNVLQIGQQPTSDRFARRGEDKFAQTQWEVGEFGSPVLTGALTSFECRRSAVHDGGDHIILVGEVLKARFEPRRDPLLYFRGKYRRLHFA